MKWFVVLLIGVMIGVVGGYFDFSARTAGDDFVTLVFTEKEIQEKIGRKFPKEKEVFNIIKIVLEEPEVTFMGESTLLDDQVVYTLKAKDYQGKMAEMLLQEIKVKEGRLEVVLGL